jgi:hypothetical protein
MSELLAFGGKCEVECGKNKLLLRPKHLKKRKDYAKCCLTHVGSGLFAAKQGRDSG